MTKYALITLFTLLCACIIIYAIWTVRVSRTRADDLLAEFRKTDRSLQRLNDSLQNAAKKDLSLFPEVELAIRAGAITRCIDSIKHDLIVLANKDRANSFSYPDTARLLALKNNLQGYNLFIQKHFSGKPGIHPKDLIHIEDTNTGNKPVKWEVYYFRNTSVFAVITELTYINTQVQKLKQKAIR